MSCDGFMMMRFEGLMSVGKNVVEYSCEFLHFFIFVWFDLKIYEREKGLLFVN